MEIETTSDLLQTSDLQTLNDYFLRCCAQNKTEIVELLLQDGRIDPSMNDNFVFRQSCFNNHPKMAKILLQDIRVDPSAKNNCSLRVACMNSFLEIIEILVDDERTDPSIDDNCMIRLARKNERPKVIELLLRSEKVDPSIDDNSLITYSCAFGFIDIVKILLKDERVDPSVNGNHALRCACDGGHSDIVRILLKDKRIDPCKIDTNLERVYDPDIFGRVYHPDIFGRIHGLLNDRIRRRLGKIDHVGVIMVLLKDGRADPSKNNNLILRWACDQNFLGIIKLLARDKRVDLCIGFDSAPPRIKAYLKFELRKIKFFLCESMSPNYLVLDVSKRVNYYLSWI